MRRIPAFTSLELVVASLLLALVLAIGYTGITQGKLFFDRERRVREHAMDILRARALLATDLDASMSYLQGPDSLIFHSRTDTVHYAVMDSALVRRAAHVVDTLVHGATGLSLKEEDGMGDAGRMITLSLVLREHGSQRTMVVGKSCSAQEMMLAHGSAH